MFNGCNALFKRLHNLIFDRHIADGGIDVKLKKCLSAVTAGAVTISALAVAQLVFADAGADTAAAEAFWGADYGMAANDAVEFVYHFDEDLNGIVVTNYGGKDRTVKIPETIDGSNVVEVDFSGCMYNFDSLMIPDTVTELNLAKYQDLLSYYNTLPSTHITEFEYYNDKELKGIVITGYNGEADIVKVPDKVKLASADDPTKVSEYKVVKVDLTDCKKDIQVLVVPEMDEENAVFEQYEDVAICINDLKTYVSRLSTGKSVAKYTFTNVGVEKMNIPASLENIGTGAFSGCMIRNVYIPENHDKIGHWSFSDCYFLSDVTVASQNAVLDDGAFRNCYSLENINIGNIDTIGDWAFSGCSSLDRLALSEELDVIGKGAFSRCVSLSGIQIPASVKEIGDYAFDGCKSLLAININEGNTNYVSTEEGILFNKSMTRLLKFPEGGMLKEYTIPESVSSIAIGGFRNSGVATVIVPDGVSKIGDGAFENCADLATIALPNSVCVIEPGAFNDCNKLTATYKNNVYKLKNSGDENDMSKTFADLYVDINTSLF